MTRKKAPPPDCQNCHSFIRVDGRPACTHVPQKEGKAGYKFLKFLTICEDFWRGS